VEQQTVVALPVDPETFAEFGEVIHHRAAGRHYIETAFDNAAGTSPSLWVNALAATPSSDIALHGFERHPHSSQSFIPLGFAACLAVVAPGGSDGGPDLNAIRAFVVGRGRGVCYRRGIWHHGFISLDHPSEVAVIMASTCRPDDTEFLPLRSPIRVLVK